MDCGQQAWGINTPVWKESYCSNHLQASSHEPRVPELRKNAPFFLTANFTLSFYFWCHQPMMTTFELFPLQRHYTLYIQEKKGFDFLNLWANRSIQNVYSPSIISIIKPRIKQRPEKLLQMQYQRCHNVDFVTTHLYWHRLPWVIYKEKNQPQNLHKPYASPC